ncbi:MAG: M48 family metalloprotease [Methylococcaceae bacterium]|nr:M48 family metalloprotease [Methylococcaceae bacterium]
MKFNAIILTLSLAAFSSSSQATEPHKINLPDMGDSSGTLISPAQEQELGAAFFRSVHRQLTINDDAEIDLYIQSMGQRLVAKSDEPANPFHFFVVLDNSINAFAGPGGYIGVNSGLLLLTGAESELASVMAHEVAHVTQRHLYRAFEAASRLSIPTAAAMLVAILIGTQSPALAQAALVAIQAGSVQFQINFTRDNEQEADRVGMQNLADANYDPRSMPTFFEHLQQSSRFYGKGIPEFLRTHPVTVSRVSDTRGRAEQYPYKQYPDSAAYLLTRAKLRVLTSEDSDNVLKYFKARETLGTKQQRAIARYGTGLAHLKKQQFNQAETIFRELQQQYPNQFQYSNAQAKTALESKQYNQALAFYKKALQRFPNNQAIKIDYISGLLKAGHPKTAKKTLQSLDERFRKRPLYFELLAQSYADLRQMAESHRYVAEYYYAVGDTKTAILQTRLAYKALPMDFYLKAILDERLRFFEDEERLRKENE